MNDRPDRRQFFAAAAAAASAAPLSVAANSNKPAVIGGEKAHPAPFPSWPKFDEHEEKGLLDVLHSGKWNRGTGQFVRKFEEAYAQMTGARECLATCNGTAALYTSLNVLGVEAGDEVILPPYTFIATVNVVLRQHALPVFVDSDIETFQMDARKVDAAIQAGTRAIMPVHLGGNVADIDAIAGVAAKHRIPLVEDACQAHLAEWKGRKVGTFGDAGDAAPASQAPIRNCGRRLRRGKRGRDLRAPLRP